MSSVKAGWQKELEVKEKQKQYESRENEHTEWMGKRDNMIKKKEEAELKAKKAEENAPEFMKKLGSMKEKAQTKPQKSEDEGPSIEELAMISDIPPWHRDGAPEKPEWVELLLLAAEKEVQEEEEEEDENVFVASTSTLRIDNEQPKRTLAESAGEESKPVWMKHASKLKEQNSKGDGSSDKVKSNQDIAGTRKQNETKPTWMLQASKLTSSSRTKESPATTSDKSKAEQNDNHKSVEATDETPAWMKQKLKPRFSTEEIQSSKVQEKLEQKQPLRKSSIVISKDELRSNTVRDKLATRPSLTDKKSSVKSEEMEWMKKKLKPRAAPKAAITEATPSSVSEATRTSNNNVPTVSTNDAGHAAAASDDVDDGKPAWMKHKLKPRVSAEELKSSKVQAKLDSKPPLRKPQLQISSKDLTANKVIEKLEKKPAMRKSPLQISSRDLSKNKVTEQLSQRPSIHDKKSPLNHQEMEWMKKKLKPRGVSDELRTNNLSTKDDDKDSRPEWMKKAQRRMSGGADNPSNDNSEPSVDTNNNTPTKKEDRNAVKDTRPAWLKETERRKSFRGPDIDGGHQVDTTSSTTSSGEHEDKVLKSPRRRDSDERPEWLKETQRRQSFRRFSLGGNEDEKPAGTKMSASTDLDAATPLLGISGTDSLSPQPQSPKNLRPLNPGTKSSSPEPPNNAGPACEAEQPLGSRTDSLSPKSKKNPSTSPQTKRLTSGVTTSLSPKPQNGTSPTAERRLSFGIPSLSPKPQNASSMDVDNTNTDSGGIDVSKTSTQKEDIEITHESIKKPTSEKKISKSTNAWWETPSLGDQKPLDSTNAVDEKFWSSMISLNFVDEGSHNALGHDSTSEGEDSKNNEFIASMNNIGAVLHTTPSSLLGTGSKAVPSVLGTKHTPVRAVVKNKERSRSKSKGRSRSRSKGPSSDRKDKISSKSNKKSEKKSKKKKKEKKESDDDDNKSVKSTAKKKKKEKEKKETD